MRGYSIPRTETGLSSLVPAPPWHYVGDFLVVDFHADPDVCVSLLPEGIEPHPDAGRCAAVFADWQSISETGDELVDPVRSQYREFYIVVSGLLDGEPVTTCVFIWVDQDFAMARGWIQGFPKKLGEVWMTRAYALPCKAAPGVAAFLNRVRELGGRIAIVTNRRANLCDDTKANFEALALIYDVMLCRTDEEDKNPRFEAVEKGTAGAPPMKVIAFLGDNIQDFPKLSQKIRGQGVEAFADFGARFFVLPNPMYGSWVEPK